MDYLGSVWDVGFIVPKRRWCMYFSDRVGTIQQQIYGKVYHGSISQLCTAGQGFMTIPW